MWAARQFFWTWAVEDVLCRKTLEDFSGPLVLLGQGGGLVQAWGACLSVITV